MSRSPRARSERRLSDEASYEELERELETIVTRLEQGHVSLDEAIALWERGEQLYKLCVGKLDSAQGKIEELSARIESAKASS
jgi:exodeoxyribonuclease VII small subunit